MEKETEIKEISIEDWQVPQCCRELWDSCKHGVPKREKQRTNKGL